MRNIFQNILYHIVKRFFQVLLLLFNPVIYLISDLLYFLVYKIGGYRKKVVFDNLKNAFPEKPKEEIERIASSYYTFLFDMMLETFQTLVFPASVISKKCTVSPEAKALFDRFYSEQKSIILVMGHFGNWEWGGSAFSSVCQQPLYVIYHPLKSKLFNRLICFMRTRYGTGLIPMKDAFRAMVKNKAQATATAFIADQSPPPEASHWMTFLNQDTPVFRGPEILSKKLNQPVVYVSVNRLKRGQYLLEAEVLNEHPKDTTENAITESYNRHLEKDILKMPETWIWSHKRWKHKRVR